MSWMARWPVVALAGVWLAYEVYMAVGPPKPLGGLDYVALAFKLTYLAGLLACSLRCSLDDIDYYVIYSSPLAAVAVRVAGGWLSCTLFTVILPALALASNLPRRDPLAAASATLTLVVMALPLGAMLYQAPSGVTWDTATAVLAAYPASAAAAMRKWRLRWAAAAWTAAPAASLACRILLTV